MEPINFPSMPFAPVVGALPADETMRKLRNETLRNDVDSVSVIRYAELTDEQKQDLITYRQALLDLPQQATWPNNVIWPSKPTWL